MKRLDKLIVLLCIIFSLTACNYLFEDENSLGLGGNELIGNDPSESQILDRGDDVSKIEDGTNGVDKEAQIMYDDVVMAYHKASEAASWFRVAGLPEHESQTGIIDMSDRVIVNDITYFRVQQFDSYSMFYDYLSNLFSNALVESFLTYSEPMYIEYNGYLYGKFGMRGTNIFMGEETYEIEFINSEKIHLLVKVEMLEQDLSSVKEYKTYIFPYELISDKWVFTDFPEIR